LDDLLQLEFSKVFIICFASYRTQSGSRIKPKSPTRSVWRHSTPISTVSRSTTSPPKCPGPNKPLHHIISQKPFLIMTLPESLRIAQSKDQELSKPLLNHYPTESTADMSPFLSFGGNNRLGKARHSQSHLNLAAFFDVFAGLFFVHISRHFHCFKYILAIWHT